MKLFLILTVLMLVFCAGVTEDRSMDLRNSLDYWKANAYVNLDLMKYRIEKIKTIDSLKTFENGKVH